MCSLEEAGRGIEVDGLHIGQVRAWGNREYIEGLVCVVLAGDDGEVGHARGRKPSFAIDHPGQFAERHAMHNGDRQGAYARFILHVEYRTIHVVAVRVGTVEHEHPPAVLCAGIHQAIHGDVVGVEA